MFCVKTSTNVKKIELKKKNLSNSAQKTLQKDKREHLNQASSRQAKREKHLPIYLPTSHFFPTFLPTRHVFR
jgi:hypothetical protein